MRQDTRRPHLRHLVAIACGLQLAHAMHTTTRLHTRHKTTTTNRHGAPACNAIDNTKWEWLPPAVKIGDETAHTAVDDDGEPVDDEAIAQAAGATTIDEMPLWHIGDAPFPKPPLPEGFYDDGDDDAETEEMLVPLTTPLRDDDLTPVSGPPVVEPFTSPPDARPLFAQLSLHPPKSGPSDMLIDRYVDWLETLDCVCHALYLLTESGASADETDLEADAEVLSEAELEELDQAIAEERARAAAAAAELLAEAGADELDSEGDAASIKPAPMVGLEHTDEGMVPRQVPLVLGHLLLLRADSLDEASSSIFDDPVGKSGGYASSITYRWHMSDDAALNSPRSDDGCVYCVLGRDRADGSSARAATRDAHLAWLRDSGRVLLGGPLEASDGGGNVGTLLFVKGESTDEVRSWATADPYAEAGVFDDVIVALAPEFFVDNAVNLDLWSY